MAINYMDYVTPYTGDPNKQFRLQKKIVSDRAIANASRNAIARKQLNQQKAQHAAALEESNRAAVARETQAQDKLKLDQAVLEADKRAKSAAAISKGIEALRENPEAAAMFMGQGGVTREEVPAEDFAVEDVAPGGAGSMADALAGAGFGDPSQDEFLQKEAVGLDRKRGLTVEQALAEVGVAPSVTGIPGFSGIEDWAGAPGERPAPTNRLEAREMRRQDQHTADVQAQAAAMPSGGVDPYSDRIPYSPSAGGQRDLGAVEMGSVRYVDPYGQQIGEGDIFKQRRMDIDAREKAVINDFRAEWNGRIDALKGTRYEKLQERMRQTFERSIEVNAGDTQKLYENMQRDYEFLIKQEDSIVRADIQARGRARAAATGEKGAGARFDQADARTHATNMIKRHTEQTVSDTILSINTFEEQVAAYKKDPTNAEAQQQLQVAIARMAEPSGVLTNNDITRALGMDGQSLVSRVKNYVHKHVKGGKLPAFFDNAITAVAVVTGMSKEKISDLHAEDVRNIRYMSEQPSAMTGLPNDQIRVHMATPMGAYRGAAVKRDAKGNKTGGWLENLDSWKTSGGGGTKKKSGKKSSDINAELSALGIE